MIINETLLPVAECFMLQILLPVSHFFGPLGIARLSGEANDARSPDLPCW